MEGLQEGERSIFGREHADPGAVKQPWLEETASKQDASCDWDEVKLVSKVSAT